MTYRRPNVLVVMLDTLRPDYVCAGDARKSRTPHLDRLAFEGAYFENAYAEYPITIPTRTALVSGNYTFTNRPWMPLRPYDAHVAEVLRENGYRAVAFSDSPFRAAFGMDRGFGEFFSQPGKLQPPPNAPGGEMGAAFPDSVSRPPRKGDRVVEVLGAAFPEGAAEEAALWSNCYHGYLDYYPKEMGHVGIERMADAAIAWLETKGSGTEPFLMWFDSFQPHEPWVPPGPQRAAFEDGYRGRYIPMPAGPSVEWMTADELAHVRSLYAGEVALTDLHVGRVLSRLDELGLGEDTLVFVCSDHGLPLGEHGTIRKFGVPVYDELAKVLWIMRKPGLIEGGRRVSAFAQTPDFLPTVLDVVGAEMNFKSAWANFDRIEAPKGLDGVSLLPLLSGEAESVRDTVYSGAFGLRASVRKGSWKLIDNRGEKPNELFDLQSDPGEQRNVWTEQPELAAEMHRDLWEFQRRWGAVLAWRDQPAKPD